MREGRAIDGEAVATLLISHDARCGGAQRCLVEVAHVLKDELGRHVELATCADGAIPQMLALGDLHAGILVPPLPGAQGVAVEALADAMLRYMVDEDTYQEHQKAAGRVFDAQFEMSATVHNYPVFFAEAGR